MASVRWLRLTAFELAVAVAKVRLDPFCIVSAVVCLSVSSVNTLLLLWSAVLEPRSDCPKLKTESFCIAASVKVG